MSIEEFTEKTIAGLIDYHMTQVINTIKMSLINNLLENEGMALALHDRAKMSDDMIEEEVWKMLVNEIKDIKTTATQGKGIE